MLGEHYATMDQDLACGKIDTAEYAAALLSDLLNRAVPFSDMVDSYLENGGNPKDFEKNAESIRQKLS